MPRKRIRAPNLAAEIKPIQIVQLIREHVIQGRDYLEAPDGASVLALTHSLNLLRKLPSLQAWIDDHDSILGFVQNHIAGVEALTKRLAQIVNKAHTDELLSDEKLSEYNFDKIQNLIDGLRESLSQPALLGGRRTRHWAAILPHLHRDFVTCMVKTNPESLVAQWTADSGDGTISPMGAYLLAVIAIVTEEPPPKVAALTKELHRMRKALKSRTTSSPERLEDAKRALKLKKAEAQRVKRERATSRQAPRPK